MESTSSSKATLTGLLANAASEDLTSVGREAKVNRVAGTQVLTCKLRLARRHQHFQQKFGKDQFNFIPETFSLVEEREEVVVAMTRGAAPGTRREGEPEEQGEVWVVKPVGLSRGRGIFLTNSPLALPSRDAMGRGMLVQRYLANPYLIKERKFDLRVYVLITGVSPLKVYVYKDGFARFATEDYGGGADIGNTCAHITNQSLHEHKVVGYFGDRQDVFSGFKWSLRSLGVYLRRRGVDWAAVWARVEEVCLKTVLLAQGDMHQAASHLRSPQHRSPGHRPPVP